jgi:hypothetical protein
MAAAGISPSAAAAAGSAAPSLLSRIGEYIKDPNLLEEIGRMISGASNAAGQNRVGQAGMDILGRDAYERQLMSRAELEGKQRNTAEDQLYRASFFKNEQPGPFNTRPLAPISPEYREGMTALEQEALRRLKIKGEYDTDAMPDLAPYTPSKPGTLEKIGDWLGPILGVGGRSLGRR